MNKTWKELLCMVLSAVMVLGLAACGSSKALQVTAIAPAAIPLLIPSS